jgi:hypothetical protein
VEIRNQNTAHGLLSSSTTWLISPYIRRLRLVGLLSLLFWNEKLPHLRSLENLRSLTITSLHWYRTSPGAVLVCNNFKTIVRLHLGNSIHHARPARPAYLCLSSTEHSRYDALQVVETG